MPVQVDAIAAQGRAQTQQLQREWEQRLEAAVAQLKAEAQRERHMQEARVEQLERRLAAVENTSDDGYGSNSGAVRSAANGGNASVSEERVAALITSVELLRGQISDLETQLSVATARRNARNGALGLGGDLSSEVDKRLRDAERGQQLALVGMEERLAAQTEAVVERCAQLALKPHHLLKSLDRSFDSHGIRPCSLTCQEYWSGRIKNARAGNKIRQGS